MSYVIISYYVHTHKIKVHFTQILCTKIYVVICMHVVMYYVYLVIYHSTYYVSQKLTVHC